MLQNYLKIAFRNLFKYKFHSLINILGLALGVGSFLVLALYVIDELTYDQFHENSERLYRLTYASQKTTPPEQWAITTGKHGKLLPEVFPEIEAAVRVCPSWGNKQLVQYRDKTFYESRFFWADPNIFAVFDFPLIQGNPQTVLKDPYSVVITPAIAEKYFGDENPIGKSFKKDASLDYIVTGIVAPPPANSHIKYDFIATTNINVDWESTSMWVYTYLLLKQTSGSQLEEKLSAYIEDYHGEAAAQKYQLSLKPVSNIHYDTAIKYDLEPASATIYPYALALIAILILGIACINFVNLSTARATMRAREVGVRKVVGAARIQLMGQFLGEALLFSLFAILIALAAVEVALPAINAFTGKALALNHFGWPALLFGLGILTFSICLLAGGYPAFLLSAFKPVAVLKGKVSSSGSGNHLRKGLVILQFTISLTLLICAGVIAAQLAYFQSKPLGFEKEQVVVTRLEQSAGASDVETLKSRLLNQQNIISVSKMQNVPGQLIQMYVGLVQPEGYSNEDAFRAHLYYGDYDLVETLGISLLDGRNFSREFATDSAEAIIINEAMAEKLGWESPIGKQILLPSTNQQGTIVALAKDFHFTSLHNEIQPLVITMAKGRGNMLAIRISGQEIPETLTHIEAHWATLNSGYPFQYYFLDEYFDGQYKSEERLGQIVRAATGLAIFIVALGLFGLILYTAERRSKEIGIRKVLGASISSVIFLLSREFFILVLIGNLLAWPLAWLAMQNWLGNFAYRIQLTPEIFITTAIFSLLVTALTISYQAGKAALANPVESLKYE